MFALGGIYGAYLLTEWIASGSLPLLTGDVLAVTAIVLGLQTIFFSFFMSAIADR
jgi:di/tricarboxylate transporter